MLTEQDIRVWVRSGSWGFMKDCRPPHRLSRLNEEHSVAYQGHTLHYRTGTSDPHIVYRTLFKPLHKREYRLPEGFSPKVVLDIGANIGAASVYLAKEYPGARVYAFEPVPENFALLKKNTAALKNVQVFPIALGAQEGSLPLLASEDPANLGGFSFFSPGSNSSSKREVPVKHAGSFLKSLGITQVDLIKVDTEGAEYDILTALDPQLLSHTGWILGELHGQRDFELLDYLSEWFFVEANKQLSSRLFTFRAKNKRLDSKPGEGK